MNMIHRLNLLIDYFDYLIIINEKTQGPRGVDNHLEKTLKIYMLHIKESQQYTVLISLNIPRRQMISAMSIAIECHPFV